MKDKLKEWLEVHERLYWFVVVALAVFAFGLITAVGCGKLAKANAAETIPNIKEVPSNSFERFSVHLASDDYLIVTYCVLSDGREQYRYMFLTSEPVFVKEGNNIYICPSSGVLDQYYYVKQLNGNWEWVGAGTGGNKEYVVYDYDGRTIAGSNFSFPEGYAEYPQCNIDWYGRKISYVYSETAPYVEFKELDNQNLVAETSFPSDWIDKEDIENPILGAYWEWSGTVLNLVGFAPDNMIMEVSFEVKVPTKDYLVSWYERGEKTDEYIFEHANESVKAWSELNTSYENYSFVYYLSYSEFSALFDENYGFAYRLSYDDILNYLADANDDFRSMYSGIDEESKHLRSLVGLHLHIESTSTLLFVDGGTAIYYGNPVINYYTRGRSDSVSAIVKADVFNSTQEELEKAISEAIDLGYDNALKDTQNKIDELQGSLDNVNQQLNDIYSVQLGIGGELTGTDLWQGFTGLSNGLGSLAPSIYSLSSLVGSVLAFFPLQVSSIMSFTLLAICVIAIVKAIRG